MDSLAGRADPHPVHEQPAQGLPGHGGDGEQGDPQQAHGEGLGKDEEPADAAGQEVVGRELALPDGREDPPQPGPAAGQRERYHGHQSQPGGETHHRGGDPVRERRPEGAVDPALDRHEQPRRHREGQPGEERKPGSVGHCCHLTSGIIACMSNPEIEEIPIRDDMIRLGQLLKLASLVEDGVEAAELIKAGLVKVNGEIDERRGRQLHHGDTVTVNGRTVRISTPAGA